MKLLKLCILLALPALLACAGCRKEEKKVELDNSLRLLVKLNGAYGFCDRGGITVIPAQFASASIFSQGLAAVQIKGKNGYIDVNGKMVIPPTFESGSIFLGNRASVRRSGKWGYINQEGKIVVEPEYLSTFAFTDGLAAVIVPKGNGCNA